MSKQPEIPAVDVTIRPIRRSRRPRFLGGRSRYYCRQEAPNGVTGFGLGDSRDEAYDRATVALRNNLREREALKARLRLPREPAHA